MPESREPNDHQVPIVVGVTGHRDLVDDEMDSIYASIVRLFEELRARFPHTPIRLMSSLAEGADTIAARAALDNDIALQAILPLRADSYCRDFNTDEARQQFDSLCAGAEVLELPMSDAEHDAASMPGEARNIAYARAGMFISAHCHILLAVWDGKASEKVGGTAQIVYFQHYDRLAGISESVPRSSLFLTDVESDLVYHVTCSRQSTPPDNAGKLPAPCWFTTDLDNPRTESLPDRYQRIFERTDEYNSDIERWIENGRPLSSYALHAPETRSKKAAGVVASNFLMADTLADHYQKRVSASLAMIYMLAVLTGLAFILYSEVAGFDLLIHVFLTFLLAGIVLAAVAGKRQWHRKYLDYRVLAEGLRVQFYWTVASVHGGGQTKFAYDNFLRQRDMELGWIRNVMRVAGTVSDLSDGAIDREGLRYTVDQWIGSSDGDGQLAYYRRKSAHRSRANRVSDRLSMACLWTGVVIALTLAFFVGDARESSRDLLIIMMGVLPLIAGVSEAYTQRKANRELSKQYQFMERVFSNARRRIDESNSDEERREVLLGLGDAALTEHAEWILTHRERQPESAQL